MDFRKPTSSGLASSLTKAPSKFSNTVQEMALLEQQERDLSQAVETDVDVDLREIYFMIMHFLSSGPCQKTFRHFWNELSEHQLLPRRYHAWYSRSGGHSGNDDDDGISFPLNYSKLVERFPQIEKDHLVKLLRQLLLYKAPHGRLGGKPPNAFDGPTILGSGSFSLLECGKGKEVKQVKPLPTYLRWPHMQADQLHGLGLREIGGGFAKHHRAPSIRSACYAIVRPTTVVQKMQNIKKLRGHRDAVYCAIFDRFGRYVITGSDDRLVKIWSMETAFCLASCRGHEGDITDLAVSSNNALVASASNDFVIRVWRLPDGLPISVLRGHTAAVTAIAFSPRPNAIYQLLSSSDDGTCRIWDARCSQNSPRIYLPKPSDAIIGRSNVQTSNGTSSSTGLQSHQILCCAYNANGTVFVTGSSDTFARVWSACKSNTDESEQPTHEMDVLSGHENDVNYVQFSGCAVPSRSSVSDNLKDENVPKFKNSWFCHDNIVTCSRDGSAIIWIPRSRRSYGKGGRWSLAYHLKVPPPPLPPQPPRGGPRQRLLPTPRGVNMIVWSLDNRFVLAAIMDCRICVWNAVDGSLVHSLTGHTASSYVLDVHPFNPRIAMSAGYDGRTIVWDIWEGTPIRTYEIGRFKLVDGKFSPDGTSIVLSDDVGQIYFLNTGQGDSQKDAKYDQFFLGDYRPLIRDSLGNVLDQETQLAPHRRNIQDPLCDGSMIPYEEPYQTMYQRRRLGALGFEWCPPSIKFATGLDFSLGQNYVMPPLEDLERMMEPVPEFIDAVYWEPENEVISDDTDSEYNIAVECSSEGEQGSLCSNSSIDPECSAEDSEIEHSHKDGLRRSRRRKHKTDVDLKNSSGRHVKKRNLDERDGSVSGSNRTKKSKSIQKPSKRKSSKAKSLRPQRVAARNARTMFSRITGTSTGEDDSEESEYDSSNSDSVLQDSLIESREADRNLQNMQQQAIVDSEYIARPTGLHESQLNNGNRKRLVLKFSLRDLKKPLPVEDTGLNDDDQAKSVYPSSRPPEETNGERKIDVSSKDPGSSSADGIDVELSRNQDIIDLTDGRQANGHGGHLEESADNENKIGWGEIKTGTSKHSSSVVISTDASTGLDADIDVHNDNKTDVNRDKAKFGSEVLLPLDSARNKELAPPEDLHLSSSFDSSLLGDHRMKGDNYTASCYEDVGTNYPPDKENPRLKLRIKTKGILRDPRNPNLKSVTAVEDHPSAEGNSMSDSPLCMEHNQISGVPEEGEGSGRSSSEQLQNENVKLKMHVGSESERPHRVRTDSDCFDGGLEENTLDAINYKNSGIDFPKASSDSIRRTRSTKVKVTLREPNAVNHNFKLRVGHELVGTSRSVGSSSTKALAEEWMPTSNAASRPRSTRSRQGGNYGENPHHFSGRKSNFPVRKLSWLMLSEHEEGYRYIPQLGDEVVYLRQGHREFIDSIGSREVGPWRSIKGHINAVEICKVEILAYATFPGSGDSCCKLTLKFIDPSSSVFDKAFNLTLPELIDFPDFIVEKTRYDAAISRNWTHRDKCLVWWRSEDGEGGNWWEGRIVSSQAKSDEFPDSPWERYTVRYKNSENHQHSPWELHDPDISWEHPQIDIERRDELLSLFAKLEKSVTRKQDCYGVQRLNEAAQKLDFLNRFAVPLFPEVILLRIEKNYYRSFEAVMDDIKVMLSNAESYFAKNAQLLAKMRRLSDWFKKTLSRF